MAWIAPAASIIGGALGGLLGGGSQSQPRNVWLDELQSKHSYNAGQNLYQMAYGLANQPYQPFGGQRFAPLNPLQAQGINRIAQSAGEGSPMLDAANQQAISTLQGQGFRTPGTNPYAGANPYLQSAIDAAQRDTVSAYSRGAAAQTDAAAARAKALGSSGYNELVQANQGELARRLGDISSGMRMQDYGLQAQLGEANLNRQQSAYDTERANQLRAMALAPGQASATQGFGFNAGNALMGAGGFLQGEAQKPLDFGYQQFTEARDFPYQQLNTLASVTPNYQSLAGYGFTPTQQSNTAANIIGGAMMGKGLYDMYSQPTPRAQQPGVTGWTSGYDLPMGGASSGWNPFSTISNWFNF